jgi:predicted Zn-dependent protease
MKKINLKNILAISIFLALPFNIYAESLIRDSEIESVIEEVIAPLKKVSGISDLKIYLIDNSQVNAFTTGGAEIFVNTGLLSNFPDPDVFRGVMAHEMGHIKGHHVARQMSSISDQGKLSLATIAVGIAGAALTGKGEFLGLGAIVGQDMFEKNVLKYSRTHESSADQAAYKMLEKSGNSTVGMKHLFKYFLSMQGESSLNPYLLTHPVSSARLAATEEFISKSKYKNSTNSSALNKRFERMSYKLLAFTVKDPEFLLSKIDDIEDSDIRSYVKSICNMRKGRHAESINSIDILLSKYPNDPYFNELKGQVLYDYGQRESLNYFEKALKLKPGDALLKMNVVIAAISVYRYGDQRDKLRQYIPYLSDIKQNEPDSIVPYYYLGQYYQLLGDEALGQINLARFYHKQGDGKRAKRFAKSALKRLAVDSTEYYWAQDIIDSE